MRDKDFGPPILLRRYEPGIGHHRHPARIAVGMAELPLGAVVETEMTVVLQD